MKLSRRAVMAGGAMNALLLADPSVVAAQDRSGELPVRDDASPVFFWNWVALQLVALDHSIEASEARAPGPCASTAALSLVHLVIADAVAAVHHGEFRTFGPPHQADYGDFNSAFISGAAAGILRHIFSTPAHAFVIETSRGAFLTAFDERAAQAWRAGEAFGRAAHYTRHWHGERIRERLFMTPTPYVPQPYRHNVDPFNADQGFYGVDWGAHRPLLLRDADKAALTIDDPPEVGSRDYRRDFAEVFEVGRYVEGGPTRSQLVGYFSAYDGARLIGPPARFLNQILRTILLGRNLAVTEVARTFALCNAAAADATIACWAAKYKYAYWRPVYAIRSDRSTRTADWRPLGAPRTNPVEVSLPATDRQRALVQNRMGASAVVSGGTRSYKQAAFTPNFPSYPSGHSTMAAAFFETLVAIQAEDGARDPYLLDQEVEIVSDELNGVSVDAFNNRPRPYAPRRYRDLRDLLNEFDTARVVLGVHWRFDTTAGRALGRQVAQAVHRLYRAGA